MNRIRLVLIAALFASTIRASTIDTVSYFSSLLNREMHYIVVKPSLYDSTTARIRRFPVMYVLHCLGGNPTNWLDPGPDFSDIDGLIDDFPFLAVIPYDGTSASWWLDSPVEHNADYATWLSGEFKQRIDSLYRTLPGKKNTGITGHSMGGFGAFHNAIRRPGIYGAVFACKALVAVTRYNPPADYGLINVLGPKKKHRATWEAVDVLRSIGALKDRGVRIRFYSGPNDWFTAENRDLHRRMDSLGIAHEYFETGEPHFNVPRDRMREVMQWFDSTFSHEAPVPIKRHGGIPYHEQSFARGAAIRLPAGDMDAPELLCVNGRWIMTRIDGLSSAAIVVERAD